LSYIRQAGNIPTLCGWRRRAGGEKRRGERKKKKGVATLGDFLHSPFPNFDGKLRQQKEGEREKGITNKIRNEVYVLSAD